MALELAHYLALHRSPLQSDETNELNQAKVGVKTAKNAGFGEKKKMFSIKEKLSQRNECVRRGGDLVKLDFRKSTKEVKISQLY